MNQNYPDTMVVYRSEWERQADQLWWDSLQNADPGIAGLVLGCAGTLMLVAVGVFVWQNFKGFWKR